MDDRHCVSNPTTALNPRCAPITELCPLEQARGGLCPASTWRPTSLGLMQVRLPGVTLPDTQDPGPLSAAGSPGSSLTKRSGLRCIKSNVG